VRLRELPNDGRADGDTTGGANTGVRRRDSPATTTTRVRYLARSITDKNVAAALGLSDGANGHKRLPNHKRVPLRTMQRLDDTGERTRHFDNGLGRLELCDRLIHGDLVAYLDQPAHERRLGEPLAEIWQLENVSR
jgi:hypothetical protein